MLGARRSAGAALLVALWAAGLALAPLSMPVHMAIHLGVVAVVPALLMPRLPGRPAPAALALAVAAEMVVVWGWHLPVAHLWARGSLAGFAAEQASFLAAGLLLWAAAQSAGRLGGALVLLGTVMHMTLLGAVIGLAPRPLYGHGEIAGQQLAGAMMATLGGAFYLAAALVRLAPALAEDRGRAA